MVSVFSCDLKTDFLTNIILMIQISAIGCNLIPFQVTLRHYTFENFGQKIFSYWSQEKNTVPPCHFRQLSSTNRTIKFFVWRVVFFWIVTHVLDVTAKAECVEIMEANRLDEVILTDNVTKANRAWASGDISFGQKLLHQKHKHFQSKGGFWSLTVET